MPREDCPDLRWQRAAALADGRIPPDVDPESADGRKYARMAVVIRANLDAAPPLTEAQKRFIGSLLGGDRHAAA